MPSLMNPAQNAALRRVGDLITNIRAGGYKFATLLKKDDVTLEQVKQFGVPYATGIDDVGATALRYLEAAINDKDYPEN